MGSRHSDFSINFFLLISLSIYMIIKKKKKDEEEERKKKKRKSMHSQRQLIKNSLHLPLLIHYPCLFQEAGSHGYHGGRKASSPAAAPHHSNRNVSVDRQPPQSAERWGRTGAPSGHPVGAAGPGREPRRCPRCWRERPRRGGGGGNSTSQQPALPHVVFRYRRGAE